MDRIQFGRRVMVIHNGTPKSLGRSCEAARAWYCWVAETLWNK